MKKKMLIGETPLIRIRFRYRGQEKFVYAKLEYFNLTGSIKDRIVFYMLQKAKEKGLLKEGQPLIEATSGNTGISLAAIAGYFRHPVHIFMPDWVSGERISLMKLYGAEVHLVSRVEGGFEEAIRRADQLAKEIDGYRLNQFQNEDNVLAHYETTGQEICNALTDVPAFVSGIGTGGTLMGIGKRLLEKFPNVKIVALEPKQSPILSKGTIGVHQIEGIGDDFVPSIVDRAVIDDILLIDDEDAMNMARRLARELGLGVGISSGANFLAAALLPSGTVTIFVDDAKKYLSTKLSHEVDSNSAFISNQIELLDFTVVSG